MLVLCQLTTGVCGLTIIEITVLFRLLATAMLMQLQSRDQTQATSQLIGQFGHVTASASCKQPEKHSSGVAAMGLTPSCGMVGAIETVGRKRGSRERL